MLHESNVIEIITENNDNNNNNIHIRLYCCRRPSSWGIQQSANAFSALSPIEWIRIFQAIEFHILFNTTQTSFCWSTTGTTSRQKKFEHVFDTHKRTSHVTIPTKTTAL